MSNETEWVLVPREPTEAMVDAFFSSGHTRSLSELGHYTWQGDCGNFSADCAAMLAAAPQPPAEAQTVYAGVDLEGGWICATEPEGQGGDEAWLLDPRTVEFKVQWDAVAHALGADVDDPDAVLAAAKAKQASSPVGAERILAEMREEGQADIVDGGVVLEWEDDLRNALAQQPAAVDDAALLDAMAREYWKLDPFDMPTPGGDDADVGWRVIEYHGDEPREREVAVHYADDPRAALRAALAAQPGGSDNDH